MTTDAAPSLQEFLNALTHPSAALELAVIAGCLGLAWALVRLLHGAAASAAPSVLFGRRLVDGLLFPVLALGLALAARRALVAADVHVAVFKIVIPVLVAFAVIRLAVRVLEAAFPTSRVVRVIERSISWLVWAGMVGWVTGLLPELLSAMEEIHWKMGGSTVSLRTLVEGTVSAGVVLIVALWISAAIEARLLSGASGENLSLRKVVANTVRALLVFVGLLVGLTAVGIDLTALSVLGGAMGVGIGLGLQKLAANYVSGFVILTERSLRIGDTVRVDNFEGRITDIAMRYTVIRSPGGREAIVPNEMLITQRVENSSLADPQVLLQTTVPVAYGTDLDALFPQIVAAVTQVPRVMAEPAPVVHLSAFAADGLELTVNFWITDLENGAGGVRSGVNLAILALLSRLGVEIPYPQRVIRQA
ncbi:mechanosensitive ion channel [Ideonella sp. 4Y16]|uniref:mechanosensitive ion channel family protein n=1 Tax=Ideonella alba TaxID=2824118 RepID=UPI001B37394A|nr:mechanosensitive ion channel domain-containing protein [Ideonella alba]MBQ0944887.1 mechanosensitive ion channel [Ideonella alba]